MQGKLVIPCFLSRSGGIPTKWRRWHKGDKPTMEYNLLIKKKERGRTSWQSESANKDGWNIKARDCSCERSLRHVSGAGAKISIYEWWGSLQCWCEKQNQEELSLMRSFLLRVEIEKDGWNIKARDCSCERSLRHISRASARISIYEWWGSLHVDVWSRTKRNCL